MIHGPSRRSFLKQVVAGGAVVAMPSLWQARSGQESRKPSRPNIVFILVDDMGWADLSCYGSKAIETPNIDRLARQGVRFTNAYSGCTVCAPARSTLHGRQTHGAYVAAAQHGRRTAVR